MARKTPCPVCGAKFIKGRIVVRLVGSDATRQRVCQTCAGLAVPVLASDAQARCEVCGVNLARVCKGCIGKLFEAHAGATIPDMMAAAAVRRGAKTKKEKPRSKV